MGMCQYGTYCCIKIGPHSDCYVVPNIHEQEASTEMPIAPTPLQQATKHDQGKPDLTYPTYELMYAVSRVREFGAKKYSRDNFKQGKGTEWILRNFAAALRHIFKRLRGEILDSESGLPHTWHAVCCLEHIIYAERSEETGKIE